MAKPGNAVKERKAIRVKIPLPEMPKMPAVSLKNKILIGIGLPLVIAGGVALTYFIGFRGRVLVQLPMRIMANPEVTYVTGEAYYRHKNDKEWEKVEVGTRIKRNYELKTGKEGSVDIAFNEETVIRIENYAHFQINEYSIQKIELELMKGALFGKFRRQFLHQDIRLLSPTSVMHVLGTEMGYEVKEMMPVKEPEDDKKTAKDKKSEKDKKAKDAKEVAQAPVLGTVAYSLSGMTEISSKEDRQARIQLSGTSKTTVQAGAPPQEPVQMEEREVQRVREIINSLHVEKVLVITNKILFAFDSAKILPESYDELARIAQMIRKSKRVIRIEGHTDNIGKGRVNLNLSRRRATAVREYLIDQEELSPRKLRTAGYGASKPIASNRTEEGRKINRRVEFLIAR